jgi:hypothetical protein
MSDARIVIVVEGGVIQSVSRAGAADVDVVVIDYDTEGEIDDVTEVPQSNGGTAEAFVSRWPLSAIDPLTSPIRDLLDGLFSEGHA